MLLAAGFLSEFSKFIQIISWIVLPIAAIAIFITVYSHYRKKNKSVTAPIRNANEAMMLITQGNSGQKINDADYIYIDHFALINEYEKRLACSHARFAALKKDFLNLKVKYSILNGSPFLVIKNNMNMQYPDVSQQYLQAEELPKENNPAVIELPEQFNELSKINQLLEKENQLLKEQLKLFKATDDEKAAIINRWNDENSTLQNKVTEQEYLKEIVEEKKAYINFLQQQLEQRILTQHQSEQKAVDATVQLEQLRKTMEGTQFTLNNEVLQKKEETEKLNAGILEKEEQLKEKKQLLISKLDHITYLENILHEIKQHNEILNATIADEKKLTASLQEKSDSDQSRIKYLEQKVNGNKQMLKRLYKELTSMVGTETGSRR
jgi:chromosome segregation ATPase